MGDVVVLAAVVAAPIVVLGGLVLVLLRVVRSGGPGSVDAMVEAVVEQRWQAVAARLSPAERRQVVMANLRGRLAPSGLEVPAVAHGELVVARLDDQLTSVATRRLRRMNAAIGMCATAVGVVDVVLWAHQQPLAWVGVVVPVAWTALWASGTMRLRRQLVRSRVTLEANRDAASRDAASRDGGGGETACCQGCAVHPSPALP